VAVNCGAIPENLIESTLFGHEKGAFTGATERHVGKFQEASGGTLFLDEVGELPAAAQVKLLRALQEGEVEPVGGRKPVKVDVRLVSATNRNLTKDVADGRFREDLFYRLHVFPIVVPPLRSRAEDIPDLARHFVARFAAEEGKRVHGLSGEAVALLSAHGWPGNVRQLENAVFRAVVLAEADVIGVDEFPQIAALVSLGSAIPLAPSDSCLPQNSATAGLNPQPLQTLSIAQSSQVPLGVPAQIQSRGTTSLLDAAGEVRPLEEVEAELIRFAIDHYRGQMSEVARRLRIGRSTLYRKLESLDPESAKPDSSAVADG
jgi:DNA-binding NtrC family response regulator